MCPCVADRIEFGSVEKTGVPKTTRRTIKGENQQQTQPSYGVDAGSRIRATLVKVPKEFRAPGLRTQNSGAPRLRTKINRALGRN